MGMQHGTVVFLVFLPQLQVRAAPQSANAVSHVFHTCTILLVVPTLSSNPPLCEDILAEHPARRGVPLNSLKIMSVQNVIVTSLDVNTPTLDVNLFSPDG